LLNVRTGRTRGARIGGGLRRFDAIPRFDAVRFIIFPASDSAIPACGRGQRAESAKRSA
jgi:hypothetical protein